MVSTAIWGVIIGLVYGSFLNALLWRLPRNLGMRGRSKCFNCGHKLSWSDLIPIVSFLALRGHCRYCNQKIPIRYLLVELLVGLIFGTFFYFGSPSLDLYYILILGALFVFVSLLFFDLFYFILPDIIVVPAILVFTIYNLILRDGLIYFSTSLLMAAFFAIIYTVSRGKQLGFGDVKLAFLIGLILGYPLGFIAVVLGVWMAAIISLFLLAAKKVSRKDPVPLGSFLAIASILAIIFPNEILSLFPFLK